MDENPSRAKRRISSSPSHGFLERLRRSTLFALVSVPEFVIACCPRLFVPENKKPTASSIWRWVISAGIRTNSLGRHPPRASAHACATTTSAHTRRGKILPDHLLHSRPAEPCGQ